MNIAEAAEKLLEKFSEAVEALAEWATEVLKSLSETLRSLEPDRKAPISLDRPLMAIKYPETFKYLRTKRIRGVSYG